MHGDLLISIASPWLWCLVAQSTSASHLWAASRFKKCTTPHTVVTRHPTIITLRRHQRVIAVVQIAFHPSSRLNRLIIAFETRSLTIMYAGRTIEINWFQIRISCCQVALLDLQIPLIFGTVYALLDQLLILTITGLMKDHVIIALVYGIIGFFIKLAIIFISPRNSVYKSIR